VTDKDFIKQLGKSISTAREARDMSQLDLCSEIGMEKTNLSAIENGRKNISSTTIRRIADGLGCEIGDLFKFYKKTKK
jgi:transcriptional regulator with XRE-family HTH domain